jgi:hypothetical protein
MSRGPKCPAAYALSAASITPKPVLNSALPATMIHSAGAAASAASAALISTAPKANSGPCRTRARIRPVAALDTTAAATPATSTIPSAPTGSWMLIRIDGHSMPSVEPGSATLK